MTATQIKLVNDFTSDIQPLGQVSALLDRVNESKCRYCHWKTNLDLEKALSGVDDLDLLVAGEDFAAFNIALLQENFKEAESITSRFQPGVYHFLGNDAATGTLLNAHLHSRTMTGDHFIKSWVLPFEEMLLEKTTKVAGMPVPRKEAELIIYVVRSMIKHASLFDTPNSRYPHPSSPWISISRHFQKVQDRSGIEHQFLHHLGNGLRGTTLLALEQADGETS